MEAVKKLNKWANAHSRYYLLDTLRWAFGAFLFYKGLDFMINTDYLSGVINPGQTDLLTLVLVHYVAMVHLAGGLFIVLGLLTRIVTALQIPILVGAVIVNFVGTMMPFELLQAGVALVFSVFFFTVGSGKHSVDYNLKLQM